MRCFAATQTQTLEQDFEAKKRRAIFCVLVEGLKRDSHFPNQSYCYSNGSESHVEFIRVVNMVSLTLLVRRIKIVEHALLTTKGTEMNMELLRFSHSPSYIVTRLLLVHRIVKICKH